MKCPYCMQEMKQGYVRSGQPFRWKRENDSYADAESVKLSKGFWNGCYAPADYCPDCKKVILSIEP